MNNKKRAICTIVSLNYFAQAMSLMKSVRKQHKDVELHILLVDVTKDIEVKRAVEAHEELAHITYVSDIGIEGFEHMSFKYSVVELNTAVKPFFLEYLLEKYAYENAIYVDSDILLFQPLDKIYDLLENDSIVLTPHLISSEEDEDTEISKLDDFLQYGVYNLGFIAIKNDENGRDLLKWWAKELREKCLLEPEKFLAWDQKWMDFTPALFDGVYVLRDPGYNAAFWNIQKRYITKKDGIYYVNDKYPLVFYHFSHYRLTRKDRIVDLESESRCMPLSKRKDLEELFEIYYNSVKSQNYDYFSQIKYGFCTYRKDRD